MENGFLNAFPTLEQLGSTWNHFSQSHHSPLNYLCCNSAFSAIKLYTLDVDYCFSNIEMEVANLRASHSIVKFYLPGLAPVTIVRTSGWISCMFNNNSEFE